VAQSGLVEIHRMTPASRFFLCQKTEGQDERNRQGKRANRYYNDYSYCPMTIIWIGHLKRILVIGIIIRITVTLNQRRGLYEGNLEQKAKKDSEQSRKKSGITR